ncbi:MAG: hypothetical protein RLZZ200_807 [Pseudomonadota bacterium]|jgi:lysophospholipase L1-like esterase
MKAASRLASLWLLACFAGASIAQEASSVDLPLPTDSIPGEGPLRQHDWFRELWNSRRRAWLQAVEKDQRAVVFLGDSITQGLGDDLERRFPGLKSVNRGISGDTTRGVLIRLSQDVIAIRPRAVVLLLGTNDIEEDVAPELIVANMKEIIARLTASDPSLRILLCKIFPSSASKKRPAERILRVNELYAEAVVGDRQVTLVDTWGLFANGAGDAKTEEFPDLLHPNEIGYSKWTAYLAPLLIGALMR